MFSKGKVLGTSDRVLYTNEARVQIWPVIDSQKWNTDFCARLGYMSFGFSPDYAEQEAIKRRDNTQSDKGKFLFVKLSLIDAQWLSNLYQNGNLFCAAQLNRRKRRVVVRSCLSKTRPAEKRIKISTRKL